MMGNYREEHAIFTARPITIMCGPQICKCDNEARGAAAGDGEKEEEGNEGGNKEKER